MLNNTHEDSFWKTLAGLVCGITLYILVFRLGVLDSWIVILKNQMHVWWPLVFIAAGIAWWIADRQFRTRYLRSGARSSWRASHD